MKEMVNETRSFRRFAVTGLVAALTMFAMLLIGARSVRAEKLFEGVLFKKNATVYLNPSSTGYPNYWFSLDGLNKNEEIVSKKSSNKKVVSIDKYGIAKVKKAGKATITFKVRNKKTKKTRKVKAYVVARPIASPFKSVTIAGEKQKQYGAIQTFYHETSADKVKVSYKLKKGWKIVKKLRYLQPYPTRNKLVKSGTTVKVPYSFTIALRNKRTGDEAYMNIVISGEEDW